MEFYLSLCLISSFRSLRLAWSYCSSFRDWNPFSMADCDHYTSPLLFNHRLTTYSSASSVLPVANTKWLRRGSPWHRDTCWSWARVWRAAGTSLSIGGGVVYSTGGVMTPLQRLVTECEGHKNRIAVKASCTCNGQR